jgi:parallel beta-helix repeat protein
MSLTFSLTTLTKESRCSGATVVIDGNGHMLHGQAVTYGFNLTNVDNVTINNATVSDFAASIYSNSSSGNILSNIEIANSHPEGLNLKGFLLVKTNDSQIVDNNIVNNDMGICLQSCFGNNVSGNKGTTNDAGIGLYNSCNNTLSNNSFGGFGLFVGGFLYSSSNNTLSGNYMTDFYLYGFELSSSDNNTLIGNDATSNALGIYLLHSNNNILVANNVAHNNGQGSKGGNGGGIFLEDSSNNIMYHNNFVENNLPQAFSDGSPNTWDNGYPSGGNYWSDYNGVDAETGQYQNLTGSDGIGDTPYSALALIGDRSFMDANNTDHYPLMNLYRPHSFYVAKTVVGQGFNMLMYFAGENYGDCPEMFNVTVYANMTSILSENVTIMNGNSVNIIFMWNTTILAYGTYNLTAYAWSLVNGTYTSSDNFTGGLVTVSIPGDLNGDFNVSRQDLVILMNAYGSRPRDSNWNPDADINGDSKVNLLDLVTLANHYGQHYP